MSCNKSAIPDRWLKYKSVGKQIDVTPFLAFKVPLQNSFFPNVPSDKTFSPSDLIEMVPNLSFVIDLTNTQKYYSPNNFINRGIQYRKIFCPGHQIPPKELVQKFFEMVDDFMKQNRDNGRKDGAGLIGVHCTHGINRTGFFICSYMINKMGYNPEKAITEFNSARGHNIERVNYLNALKNYDVEPFEFQHSQYDVTDSSNNLNYDNYSNDCFVSQNSYHRQYPSESYGNHYNAYRSSGNHHRNTFQNSKSFYRQSRRRDFDFHNDHPLYGDREYGNSRRQNNAWHPNVLNQPALKSVYPYFSSHRRSKWNSRNRK